MLMKLLNMMTFALAGLVLVSCSREFENKELVYQANRQGFFKAEGKEGKLPTFDIITIKSITDDWDGDEEFAPSSGSNKLIKVEVYATCTNSDMDLGINEQNLELYNKATGEVIPASLDINVGSTFPALDKRYTGGYVVYEIPTESKFEDLFIGLHYSEGISIETKDWSKEEVSNLLPLKEVAYDATERTQALNAEKVVADIVFNTEVKYQVKSITYNCNDDAVKAYKKENSFDEDAIFVRLDMAYTCIVAGRNGDARIEDPYLVGQYKILSAASDFGDYPDKVAQDATVEASSYFQVEPGQTIIGITDGYRLNGDFFFEVK